MKKIIALAVASAFVAPVMAAEVTVSGDVEYMYIEKAAGSYFDSGDQDITVTGSDDLGNGLTVTASLELDGTSSDSGDSLVSDSSLKISGSNWSVQIGDATDAASEIFDEKSDKAEQGGTSGETVVATEHSVLLQVTPADGLTVALSTGTTEDSTAATTVTSYAAQYTLNGVSIAYGVADNDAQDKNITTLSVGFAVGPVSVGYESISNVLYVDKDDQTNLGLAYNYGQGNIFIESGELKDASASTKTETQAFGVSYKMGKVNMYALQNTVSATGSTDDDQTYIGVEYAF